jgi:hypothetical protein
MLLLSMVHHFKDCSGTSCQLAQWQDRNTTDSVHVWSQGSSISIVSMNWMTRLWSLAEAKYFSPSLCVQTASEAHPASHSKGKAQPGCDGNHLLPSSTIVKNKYKLYVSFSQAPPWCVQRIALLYSAFHTFCPEMTTQFSCISTLNIK